MQGEVPPPPVSPRFKPIPDEEGTETHDAPMYGDVTIDRFKPIPDEEGTETRRTSRSSRTFSIASNRSPMRRGLKHIHMRACVSDSLGFKPIPDEEGTETSYRCR